MSGIVLAVVGGVLLALVLFTAWRAFRAVRRRYRAARVRISELQAKVMPAGPQRDAALLRQRLQTEMRATRDMLESAPQGLVFRADAAALLAELAATSADVDRELAAIARFADVAQQRLALANVQPQAEQLIETTYTARQTILRTAAEDRAHRLSTIRADVARQAAALEVYTKDDPNLQL